MHAKKIRYIIAGVSLAGAVLPFSAFGIYHGGESGDVRVPGAEIKNEREDMRARRREVRDEMQEKRETMRASIQEEAQKLREGLRAKAEALKQEIREQREAFQMRVKQERDQFRESAKARMDEFKKKLGEERAMRIEKFFSTMVTKIESAIDRLNKTADRIDAMIEKAEAAGRDMTKAKTDVALARTKIQEAVTALADAKAKYADLVKTDNHKKAFEEVRMLTQQVSQKVRDAHAALVRVITGLKGIGRGAATSSPAATPSQ